MKNGIDCPVDFISVNENKVRLVALLVLALGIVFIVSDWWVIIAFLIVDFALRSFNLGKFSALGIVADALVKTLGIKIKRTDQAPKRFAARLGLAFTIVILACSFLQFTISTIWLSIMLCIFAFLESVLGFCVGCYVYSFYNRLFGKALV